MPVILEQADYVSLNHVLNNHVKRKLSRDMATSESIDAGSPIFGQKFKDADQDSKNFHAIRLKMKAKVDQWGDYITRSRMYQQDGTPFTDLATLRCSKAVICCELYFIKETNGTACSYRWSVNIIGLNLCEEKVAWLEESTIPENQKDELAMLLSSVGDTSSFFNSGCEAKRTSAEGKKDATEQSMVILSDEGKKDEPKEQDEFGTPSPKKTKKIRSSDTTIDNKRKNKKKKHKIVDKPHKLLSAVSAAKQLDF